MARDIFGPVICTQTKNKGEKILKGSEIIKYYSARLNENTTKTVFKPKVINKEQAVNEHHRKHKYLELKQKRAVENP